MPGTLRLTRTGNGIELRRGTFDVDLDGTSVATIKWGDTVQTPLEPGHHTLRITVGRYSSAPHDFDSADGEVVAFRCHGAMLWPRYVAALIKPDLGISLRRE